VSHETLLDVLGLAKAYGALKAVDQIGFAVRRGEIYGLLGPNGAGKTTTISCVCGLLKPDAGRITLDGIDLAADPLAFKRRIGVVPQEVAIYGDLTVQENLAFWGRLAGLRGAALRAGIDEVATAVGLIGQARTAARKLSGGFQRRLNLAIGLVHRPALLLLDEPTVGIDVETRVKVLELVRRTARGGTAVLYTTHYLEEAQELCDRIGILDRGRILAEGTLEELRRLVGEGQILTLRGAFSSQQLQAALGREPAARIVSLEDGRAMIEVRAEGSSVPAVLARVLGEGIVVGGVSIQEPSLEAVFLKLTGRELRSGEEPA